MPLAAGKPVRIDRVPSFVDGIGGMGVLTEMWPLVSAVLAGALAVGACGGGDFEAGDTSIEDTEDGAPTGAIGGHSDHVHWAMGEMVDPYTGKVLPEPRHQGFFRTTMQLHRWLVAGDIGKQVVGASTVILVFFCLSGLYLRWPRRWRSLRTWLALDWRQKGRNFLWHLHSVVGTWVLLSYLVMALTGLWWSYGWYREAVNDWAARGAAEKQEIAAPADRGEPPPFDIDAAWQAFTRAAPEWSTATLALPRDDQPVSVRYLDADPAHERARNELALDRWTLQPVAHERYDDGSLRQKIGASMFALHRGSFFGIGGTIVFMLTSFAMPLFAVSGWMLYRDRRRRKRGVRAAGAAAAIQPQAPDPRDAAPLLVLHASQTGTAEALALRTAATLREAGCAAEARSLASIEPEDLGRQSRALFVVST